MNILLTIVSLGLLVFIHELGHFLTARYFGVKIETFSIGFGPKLFSFKKKDTTYAISLIPLGGFVKMKGENPDEEENRLEDDSFAAKKWWQRALIAFAGPVFNLFLAFIFIVLSFLIGRTYQDFNPVIGSVVEPYTEYFEVGDTVLMVNDKKIRAYTEIFQEVKENQNNHFVIMRNDLMQEISIDITKLVDFYNSMNPVSSNIVGEVNPGMPAWKAGIKTGDRILMVDNQETNDWLQVRNSIINSKNETISLKIERDDKIFDINLIPDINPLSEEKQKIIGISQHMNLSFHEKYNLTDSVKFGTITTASFVYLNYKSLYLLVKNPAAFKNSIGGPVMVFSMTAQSSKKGFSDLILFISAISILLMIMNLLPIPVLDGGHILFCIIEGIIKKPVPLKIQIVLQQFGFLVLISLMFFAFYSDFNRLFQRHSSMSKQQLNEISN